MYHTLHPDGGLCAYVCLQKAQDIEANVHKGDRALSVNELQGPHNHWRDLSNLVSLIFFWKIDASERRHKDRSKLVYADWKARNNVMKIHAPWQPKCDIHVWPARHTTTRGSVALSIHDHALGNLDRFLDDRWSCHDS